ncbi:hypothetical protein DID80_07740 [Candidatus Marinamargulisbacteria bacterium SCGC AAA071-K20]|nr:hypothetical protein DID80_07740 [Candidatus Marinamargulisbacteria bacterium SCGC AAA071-K20]
MNSERFTDTAWTTGNFNKATISPSQTALNNWTYFLKYQLIPHLKFKPEKPSISFKTGTFVHEWFQNILMGNAKIEDAEKHFKTHIEQFKFSEKHRMKSLFLLKNIKGYVQRHLDAIKEISTWGEGWGIEKPFSDWYDNKYLGQTLNIANEGYIDCYNDDLKIITEHKNRFGSAKLSPLKKEPKKNVKPNENRIGDWTYTKSQKINKPQFTHCIQVAVYSKHYNYKYQPYLIYVGDSDYTIFTKDNCWELSNSGLEYFFEKFIQINIQRQEMLRIANGDIRKLAIMIGVDWSEIRNYKNNFLLENYHEEDMYKLETFYEQL